MGLRRPAELGFRHLAVAAILVGSSCTVKVSCIQIKSPSPHTADADPLTSTSAPRRRRDLLRSPPDPIAPVVAPASAHLDLRPPTSDRAFRAASSPPPPMVILAEIQAFLFLMRSRQFQLCGTFVVVVLPIGGMAVCSVRDASPGLNDCGASVVFFDFAWSPQRRRNFLLHCVWSPPTTWVPLQAIIFLAAEHLRSIFLAHMHAFSLASFNVGISNMEALRREQHFAIHRFVLQVDSAHRSGKASADVRGDRRSPSMPVLRSNVSICGVSCLSPVKHIRYLRLKSFNPRRHSPIRQFRGAPTVLSECYEDPWCRRCGHPSLSARRPRRRHRLCVLHQKFELLLLVCFLFIEHVCMSHCVGSSVVTTKLQCCFLGRKIPNPCTLVCTF